MEPPSVEPASPPARSQFPAFAINGLFALAVVYTLYFAKALFLPLVIAALLNFLFSPLVRTLRRRRIPEVVSAFFVVAGILSIVVVGIFALSEPAADFIRKAPVEIGRMESRLQNIILPLRKLNDVAEKVQEKVSGEEKSEYAGYVPTVVTSKGPGIGMTVVGRAQAFLGGSVIVLVLTFFLLASGDMFLEKLVRVVPSFRGKKLAVKIDRRAERDISSYLLGITIINLSLGLLCGIAFYFAGLPHPILWAVVVAALNYIPFLGPMVGFVILFIAGMLSFDTMGRAVIPVLIYGVFHFVEGNFVTPAIIGRRLSLNAVMIFLSLLFGTWLWGIAGALLAVPVLATIKILCDHIEGLESVGEFLSGRPPSPNLPPAPLESPDVPESPLPLPSGRAV